MRFRIKPVVNASLMLLMLGLGFIIGSGNYYGADYLGEDLNTSLDEPMYTWSGDQKVVFMPKDHEEMRGRVGFVETYSDNTTMYLQAGRPIEDIYTTCNHEEMHNRGILSDNHPYINRVEDSIVNPLCLEAIYEFGAIKEKQ